jgi:hypothetical protein
MKRRPKVLINRLSRNLMDKRLSVAKMTIASFPLSTDLLIMSVFAMILAYNRLIPLLCMKP